MRVRGRTAALGLAITEGTKRSQTFRRLVETINASDGLVYVEHGECRGRRACLVAIIAAGPHRILRVKVDTRKADGDLIGVIGHELQHAVEVLGNPTVTDNAVMYLFYLREGRWAGPAFETEAAMKAGHDVRAEVRRDAPVPAAR